MRLQHILTSKENSILEVADGTPLSGDHRKPHHHLVGIQDIVYTRMQLQTCGTKSHESLLSYLSCKLYEGTEEVFHSILEAILTVCICVYVYVLRYITHLY